MIQLPNAHLIVAAAGQNIVNVAVAQELGEVVTLVNDIIDRVSGTFTIILGTVYVIQNAIDSVLNLVVMYSTSLVGNVFPIMDIKHNPY
ncbi:hypothetical protein GOP47_0021899 [Adiantum capillus-veneris]|uniref:Uncharacterized protein n=1 Tax=Adiantum capillus-veneris TaxID=13818 RepID=A0A9D4Z7C9_ADICA|nr:hypothetical protein GOP47_0021899 [Adiantum capillus-veneris]